jgi:hypothetical protein
MRFILIDGSQFHAKSGVDRILWDAAAGFGLQCTLILKAPRMALPEGLYADEPGFGSRLPLIYNVVYCSRATAGVDEAAVQHLLVSARRANAVNGITGLLVFGCGIFFQWLEGPRSSVLALLALLRTDRRHEDIVLLDESEEARERLFPDWDMEQVTGEHIRDVLQDALDQATDPHHRQALSRLLADLDTGLLKDLAPG